jgi:hypothetical protein
MAVLWIGSTGNIIRIRTLPDLLALLEKVTPTIRLAADEAERKATTPAP